MNVTKKILLFGSMFTLLLVVQMAAAANPGAPAPAAIPCPDNLPCIQEDTQKSGNALREYLFEEFAPVFFQGWLGLVAIISVVFIIVGGMQMHLAFGNEEALGKAKKTLLWAIIGLVLAILAVAIVQIISNLPFK